MDPLVEGFAYAEQFYAKDTKGKTVIPLIMHGDAAFAGQGMNAADRDIA